MPTYYLVLILILSSIFQESNIQNKSINDTKNLKDSIEWFTEEFHKNTCFIDTTSYLKKINHKNYNSFTEIVFEFANVIPSNYDINYVEKPIFTCGSGEKLEISGNNILKIDFKNTSAHSESGEIFIKNKHIKFNDNNLNEMKLTCDFEGKVIINIGMNSQTSYNLIEQHNNLKLILKLKDN